MKPSLLILTMLVSSLAFSQSAFKIETYFAIDRPLLPDRLTLNNDVYENLSAGTALDKFVCIGLAGEYRVAPKLSVRAAFGYWNRKFEGNRIGDLRNGKPVVTSFGLRHVDLSQGLRYYIAIGHLAVFAEGGLTSSILCKNTAYLNTLSSNSKPEREYMNALPANKYVLSAYAGVGIEMSFNDVWQLNIAFAYKNGITPYIEGFDYRMKSTSVSIGIAAKIGERNIAKD